MVSNRQATWQATGIATQPIIFQSGLAGQHQGDNAAVALMAFQQLMMRLGKADEIDWQRLGKALATTYWAGRMELMQANPAIYLDGAHNAAGLATVQDFVQQELHDYEVTLLYAGLKRKHQELLVPLLQRMPVKQVWLTTFEADGAMTAGDWQLLAPDCSYYPDWCQARQAFESQVYQANKPQALIITGSLYFIAEVRAQMIA